MSTFTFQCMSIIGVYLNEPISYLDKDYSVFYIEQGHGPLPSKFHNSTIFFCKCTWV